jgi:hypothetical protein
MKLTQKYLKSLIAEVIAEQEDEKDKDGKKILNDDDIINVNDTTTGRWQEENMECHEYVEEDCNECGSSDVEEGINHLTDGNVTEYDEECEGCDEKEIEEVSPPGWEGTVKAMKKHPEIDNPWALSWYMKNKKYKSHK